MTPDSQTDGTSPKSAKSANDAKSANNANTEPTAGGWGSLKGIASVLFRERSSPAVVETLARQNKAGGHMCTSCAWGKPAHPHTFEFCENGAKATLWDLTSDRCTPDFFCATASPSCAAGATTNWKCKAG